MTIVTTATDRHPLATVKGLRAALTHGSTIRLVNHVRPEASRTTAVLPATNTVNLVTHAVNKDGKDVESHLSWPKAVDLTADESDPRTATITYIDLDGTRKPFVTITVLESEHLDALDVMNR